MKRAKRLALCSLFCALSVVILYLGSLIGVLDLSACALTCFLGVILVIEYGGFWPWLVYIATGVLALLLLPDKSCVLLYVTLAGAYPMVKQMLEKTHLPGALVWVLKLLIFNVALAVVELVSFFVLNIEVEGIWLEVALFVMGNVAFVLLDIVLTRFIVIYYRRLRPRLRFFK